MGSDAAGNPGTAPTFAMNTLGGGEPNFQRSHARSFFHLTSPSRLCTARFRQSLEPSATVSRCPQK